MAADLNHEPVGNDSWGHRSLTCRHCAAENPNNYDLCPTRLADALAAMTDRAVKAERLALRQAAVIRRLRRRCTELHPGASHVQ